MKAWQIFTHSLRQVFGNMGAAVRVSLVPFVGLIVAFLVLGGGMMFSMMGRMEQGMEGGMGGGGIVLMLVLIVVYIGVFTMIAVNWHRFVLLNEPVGWMPQVRMDRILAYFGTALLVGLIMAVLFLMVGLLVSLTGMVGIIVGIPVFVLLVSQSFRFTTALPGAALGQGGGISGAMAATSGQWLTLLGLTVIYLAASIVVGLVAGLLSMIPLLGILIYIAFQWAAMMVGLSILTTLYGHYVEGRALA
ncbi:threonine dehydratase [Paragemmobacter straminiformis]|uniref:Threonine dehydratase n=1 Tax=Paragemmobacter straminiformis TaxID=2045119 RepID=A0A842I8W2_9RHOB|nr:threonine dehydratase [Gemmobacter straminiformis]MBC2836056.1 threonine dehydratase [Gemmobacter straminiformis]